MTGFYGIKSWNESKVMDVYSFGPEMNDAIAEHGEWILKNVDNVSHITIEWFSDINMMGNLKAEGVVQRTIKKAEIEQTNPLGYANMMGYTDIYPYEILKETAKTKTIRAMSSKQDPDWRPEVIPGGFAGHCINQHSQEWFITSNPGAPEKIIRIHRDGTWRDKHGARYSLDDHPIRFYDYNF